MNGFNKNSPKFEQRKKTKRGRVYPIAAYRSEIHNCTCPLSQGRALFSDKTRWCDQQSWFNKPFLSISSITHASTKASMNLEPSNQSWRKQFVLPHFSFLIPQCWFLPFDYSQILLIFFLHRPSRTFKMNPKKLPLPMRLQPLTENAVIWQNMHAK